MGTLASVTSTPPQGSSDREWQIWVNEYPTIGAMGMTCTEMNSDEATFVMRDCSFPLNPNGAVNGGVIASACDQIMGALGMRVAPPGRAPATVALNVLYHAPAYLPLTLRGKLLAGGRMIQAIEVDIVGGDGRRCSIATGTMAVGSLGRQTREGDGA